MRLASSTALGVFLLLVWLPLATNLWPFPSAEGAESISRWAAAEAEKVQIEGGLGIWTDAEQLRRFWLRGWILNCVSFVGGLAASAMVLLRTRGWRLALLAASIVYLLLVAPISEALLPTWNSVHLWWGFAIRMHNGLLIVCKECFFQSFRLRCSL